MSWFNILSTDPRTLPSTTVTHVNLCGVAPNTLSVASSWVTVTNPIIPAPLTPMEWQNAPYQSYNTCSTYSFSASGSLSAAISLCENDNTCWGIGLSPNNIQYLDGTNTLLGGPYDPRSSYLQAQYYLCNGNNNTMKYDPSSTLIYYPDFSNTATFIDFNL